MTLSDRDLLWVIESEKAMEEYLEEHGRDPRNIDNRIWKIHFRATKRKQMGVLNLCFDRLLTLNKKRYCIPREMLVANMYKELKIPYKWNVNNNTARPDLAKSKHRNLDKFQRKYNSFPKSYSKIYAKMGPYAFDESTLKPIVKYSEFKKNRENISSQSPSRQRISAVNKSNPVATSTPKRNTVQRSYSERPFSDITNETLPKNYRNSTPRRLLTDTTRTPGQIHQLSVSPAASKTKNKSPIKANERTMVQTRVPASKSPIVEKSTEPSISELSIGGNGREGRITTSEINKASQSPESISPHTIRQGFLTEEENAPLFENVDDVEKRMESISGSFCEENDENRRKDSSSGALAHDPNNTAQKGTPNANDVSDLVNILEEASNEADSGSTSHYSSLNRRIDCGNTSALDQYRPPLPIVMTNSRQLSPATDDEIIPGSDSPLLSRSRTLNNSASKQVTESNSKSNKKLTPGTRSSQCSVDNFTAEADAKEDSKMSRKSSVTRSSLKPKSKTTPKTKSSHQSHIDDFMPKTKKQSSVDSSTPKRNLRSNKKHTEKSTLVTPSPESSSADSQSEAIGKPIMSRKSSVDSSITKKSPRSNQKSVKKFTSRTSSQKSSADYFSPRVTEKSSNSSQTSGKNEKNSKLSTNISSRLKIVSDDEEDRVFREPGPRNAASPNSSQTSGKNEKNSKLSTNISSRLKIVSDDEEDSVFREPGPRNAASQSRTQTKNPTNKPKTRQGEKKLRTIIECMERQAVKKTSIVKTKKPADVSPQTNAVKSPSKPVASSNTDDRRFRKLYTDLAVLKEAKRRARKSTKRRPSLMSMSSDSEALHSGRSSLTDASYTDRTASEIFETISEKMHSMNLRTVKAVAAGEKTNASKKSSSSRSPSLFNVEDEQRSSQTTKGSPLRLRSSGSSLNSKANVASQFSNYSSFADDEHSSDFDVFRFSGTSPAKNERLNTSVRETRSSITPKKPKSRSQPKNSPESSSSKPYESHSAHESSESRPSSMATERNHSKTQDVCNDSPRSKSSTEAAMEEYFDSRETSPRSESAKTPSGCLSDDEISLDSSVMNRKIEQFLTDTRNYSSRMEIDDEDLLPESKSSTGTAIERLSSVNENSKSVRSPTSSHSASKSPSASTVLGGCSSASASVRSASGGRNSRLENEDDDDDVFERLLRAHKLTPATEENDDGTKVTSDNVPSPTPSLSPETAYKELHRFSKGSPDSKSSGSSSSPPLMTQDLFRFGNMYPNCLSPPASKSSGCSISPSSTTGRLPSGEPSPRGFAEKHDAANKSPVFDWPTNAARVGKRRFMDEYLADARKISSLSVDLFQEGAHTPSPSPRHSSKITKKPCKQRYSFGWRPLHSNGDSSSEDDENLSRPNATPCALKSTAAASTELKNSEKRTKTPPKTSGEDDSRVTKSQTNAKSNPFSLHSLHHKRIYMSTDEEDYNTDELSVLIEESHKKKKSQQETVVERADRDFTKEVLDMLERAKTHRIEGPGSCSETKSTSLDRTTAQSSSLDALREAQWNAMPSSAETASTTAEEKLQKIRETFQKESYENYTNSVDLSECLKSQPVEKDSNYMSDDDFL